MTGVNTVYGDRDVWGRKIHADIDDSKVKAPNMFERAKEEFDAVIGAMHQHKGSRGESDKLEFKSEKTEDGKKKPTMIKKAKDEIKSLFQQKDKTHRHHHHHRKESHGTSDDINEKTPLHEVNHHRGRSDDISEYIPVDEVKAPNIFERAKEEIEAVIDTIHPKKKEIAESSDSQEEERAGFGCSIGKLLEKICSPWGDSKKD